VLWAGFMWLGIGTSGGFLEHVNELSSFIKRGKSFSR
jgi:hypothetical protein